MTSEYKPLENKQIPSFIVDLPIISEERFNVKDYGAIGDGVHLNTEAINKTIEVCSNAGGGTVVIPSGIWLTGPLRLKSKVNLHVEFGSLVLFTDDYKAYPLIMSSFEGEPVVRCQSPIDGEGLEDVAITGKGVFDGSGERWRPVKKWKMTEKQWAKLVESGGTIDEENEIWWPTQKAKNGSSILAELKNKPFVEIEDYLPVREYLRPNLLSLRKSKRILIDGPTFQNSPAWNLHPWLCQHITIRNITVRNPWYSQNGDGLDLESCRYATVTDSVFDVGDDAICIKSGKNEAGRRIAVPSEDILVERCIVYSGHGGVVIGSEMSGGVRNIKVRDCLFSGTDKGIRFKTVRGRGGIVENISIEKIRMNKINQEAIIFQMYYEEEQIDDLEEEVTDGTPVFRNIYMEDIQCTNATSAIVLKGLPEMPLDSITFKKISIVSQNGIEVSNAKKLDFCNMEVDINKGPLMKIKNCDEIFIKEFKNHTQVCTFMDVSGINNRSIKCIDSKVNCEQMLEVATEVNRNQIVIN
ncbi:glycoside hydrolase family 28 protein [Aquibacillus rhizosphaerae]|uniref:Glycoside hydrolase family 28 protein n=1 Tax=Aquibacillus rhizosphaerae TaxID=3051431 RepID=A0ABT7L362_9BACI|nr:glycoside hydrolase family 28 protein [Aquibacillus sp. LR5S19]MDL4840283.1 glycoside hydrolase family 28 protein [Aquibacillus sp. LR5S19]